MYLLDTNMASAVITQKEAVLKKMAPLSMNLFHLSALSAAEILYGLARRPEALRLRSRVQAFLQQVDIISFTAADAVVYAQLKAQGQSQGRNLAEMDMLIAAHAHSRGLILLTADSAFKHMPGLQVENWLEGD